MKTLLCTLGLALGLLSPVAALSGPLCPPKDMLAQLPGTENVTIGQANVSTADYPGMWQEGNLKASGFTYRLFVNASGSVGEDGKMRGWRVDFECDLAGHSCKVTPQGGAPKKAIEAAKAIGGCLTHQFPKSLAHPVSKPAARKALPQAEVASVVRPKKLAPMPPVVAKTTATISGPATKPVAAAVTKAPVVAKPAPALAGVATKAAPAVKVASGAAVATPVAKTTATISGPAVARTSAQVAAKPVAKPSAKPSTKPAAQPATEVAFNPAPQAPAPCWVEGLPDEAPAARTQRLLLLAGFDAGPVDGHFGKRTLTALAQALGSYPANADPSVTNGRLRDLLCQKKPGQSRP